MKVIEVLKSRNVHNEKIAIARFLLAFGMLLTMLFNNVDAITNHNYSNHSHFRVKHSANIPAPLKTFDIFTHVSPGTGKVIIIVILLTVMSGYLPQVTGFLHVLAAFSIANYVICIDGGDEVALVVAILLLPICITDPRFNQWGPQRDPKQRSINIFSSVAFIAIQAQAAFIYLHAGVAKIFPKEWQEGVAYYYFSSHYQVGAPEWLRKILEIVTTTPIVYVFTWGTILLELLLFLCLFANKRIKRTFLILGLLLHISIILVYGLVSFFFSMAGLLILYLDDGNYSIVLLNRIKTYFSKRNVTA